MRYVSLFSGIEAATVAWEPLGFEPVAFSEIDPFCCDLLAARYPNVPNLGDISKIDWSGYAGTVDLVVGGSPCQAFSVAGNRRGLMDERGRLMLEYIRAVREIRPRWLLWENVPGVLSQSNGDAFETLLDELEQCGYSLAWRVLDAQFFGVAQRRRRVFVVGHARAGCAAAVLFERESLRWDSASSRSKRQELTSRTQASPCFSVQLGQTSANGSNISEEIAPTLDCASPCAVVSQYGDVAGTLTSRNDSSPCVDRGQNIICLQNTTIGRSENAGPQGKGWQENLSFTLDTTEPHAVITSSGDDLVGSLCARDYKGVGSQSVGEGKVLSDGSQVRRLTPVECERLQGFPSMVRLEVKLMTSDELIACALANGDISVDFDTGKVYGHRGPGGIELKERIELGFIHPTGYVHINLSAGNEKKQVRAHRIVYMAAYGEIPKGMVIDHINNDKADNRLKNLQLMTSEGNSRKARLDGLYPKGDMNPQTKLTAEVRTEIIHEYATGNISYSKLAIKYGVSKSRIAQIIRECGYTDLGNTKDTPRYKALGNSMAVPVMRWIGKRIEIADKEAKNG